MELAFEKVTRFPRGILYQLLVDAYAFDPQNFQRWHADWQDFDDFFFDHPTIADTYGFITTLDGMPIGHISWDPRHQPEYVQIGHNCIATAWKGRGYGKRQLQEALRRIQGYPGLKKIIVDTNSRFIAAKNYESVGFQLVETRPNRGDTAFAGDTLMYQILL